MSTNLMRSLPFTEFGAPSTLRIEEVAIPKLGDGEALVQVKSAINSNDIADLSGRFKNIILPETPGQGLCGRCSKGEAARVPRGLEQTLADFSSSAGAEAVIPKLPMMNVLVNNLGIFEPRRNSK